MKTYVIECHGRKFMVQASSYEEALAKAEAHCQNPEV